MSLVGRTIGRYRITQQLGAGGMGVVYGAQDTILRRDVAIKVLRPEVASQQERVRRFLQEARAASALNHPNIVTVHDAGEFENGPFLVMELVEGESLRVVLRRGAFPLAKIFDIGLQAVAALTRAHESGITHRDIKPENILVRPDGYVKILDFGLAKLKEQEPNDAGSTAATIDAALTSEGSIVGTAAYMSPEQAAGRPVDSRSDIFSLALVLFEFWQGKNPFRRENVLETLYAIAHDRLPTLESPVGSSEWGLARILEKALEKDLDHRYQTMKDLGIDLRRLKQENDTGKSSPVAAATPSRFRRPVMYGIATLVVLIMTVAAVTLFRSRQATEPTPQYSQLTNFADSATSPALSPDGRMLAFIRGESTFVGPGQIYVKLLPDGEALQLTHDDRPKMSPKFSPDGARITYTVLDAESDWSTWVVPVLGGQPRAFLANAEGLTWIKDGVGQPRLLFSEMTGRGQQMGIVTSTESRAQQRTVYMPPEESGMAHRSYLSPDGKQVLLVLMKLSRWVSCGLTLFDGSSNVKQVGPSPAQCTDAAWSPDGKWMYFSADTGNGFHIWRQQFPDGVPEQVTSGATQEEGIEFAADGRSFLTSIGSSQSTLWIHDARGDRQITSEGFALLPSISPDGKKLYYLLRAGGARSIVSGELWAADLESRQRERLLPDFLMRHYTISADGQRVVFVMAGEAGNSPVWLAALDRRSAPRQVAAGDARKAFFGPGGDVLFLGQEKETNFLYSVKEDGSELPQLIPTPRYLGRQMYLADYGLGISPDGKWVVESSPTDDMRAAVVVYPTNGGSPTLICGACAQGTSFERGPPPRYVNWSPDGKFLYLSFKGSIYAIPLKPGQALPPIPASGFRSKEEVAALPGARLIPEPQAFVGPNPSVYAFTRFAIQRNIYRVPVR